ncbi:MAG: hypothetical protein ABIH46_08040, partial [Chloroflexota bacterium]
PIWMPDGSGVTISTQRNDLDGDGAIVDLPIAEKTASRIVPPLNEGFDVPLAWSPSGEYLAVASFTGKASQPTGRKLVVASMRDGQRFFVESPGDVQFIGWLAGS